MIIAQISDTHIALDIPDADRRATDLALSIADINALDPLPDVIVHTGDIVHNGRQDEYAQAAAILANARAPVYVLAGNKDNRTALRETFAADGYLAPNLDFIQYAIERYPVRLLALDTSSVGNKGDFCPERLRHLAGLVAAEATKPIVVFAHHPPFVVSEGPEPVHFESLEVMSELSTLLRRSGRIVAVCSGHVHRSVSSELEGIPAIVAPSIATALRYGSYPPHMRQKPTYYVHRIDPVRGFSTETRVAGDA
ncbi:putative 3',5'-cyclic adenosine monophosphate phosphodiesterase CpdA [Candidatus Filomicrobium marinum]|uniref:Putative 3',5'-cyclic adenosine monophosphate phosphodiesterase CpdA n=1 Tax=Candidatus Filomicrobium marinum TaxID=1608628 RepID=A0A0D6JGW1_9HYPH|nr:metallophosphoesterase [Candidatus Filomicrobium marinum]CFX46956.1 putative 3',5'-cyclic adenosine monophosphate phosphodiesterase CpdA [Candidatus Filomicrobium marinum]CPR20589.1 putative 3',5'-cyclic adenosine monophosphate phosphodiesterase CpdA [Candidatus Filomicrobium marinum]